MLHAMSLDRLMVVLFESIEGNRACSVALVIARRDSVYRGNTVSLFTSGPIKHRLSTLKRLRYNQEERVYCDRLSH